MAYPIKQHFYTLVHKFNTSVTFIVALAFILLPTSVKADLLSPVLINSFTSEFEEAAATANQNTFNALSGTGGACENENINNTRNDTGIGSCTGAIFSVFENVRELVHTANELTGTGPTLFSLGGELSDLEFALRWTAGEEFAAQGSASSDFVNGQLSGLASRLGALRLGASGFNFAGLNNSQAIYAYRNPKQPLGGGASADEYSRLGGFFNWSYGWGEKDPTAQENAFDFDGANYTFGIDYRLSDGWVIGSTFGYTDQIIDFDSVLSIVDGGVEADGFSVMPFLMYQSGNFFVSSSVGYQSMSFDIERYIKYPSFNPLVTSTDTETRASTDASITSFFLEMGYNWQRTKWSLEPYISLNTQEVNIDAFTEIDINNDGFNLDVDKQKINSLEIIGGFKIAYTLTPAFGVFTPNIDINYHSQQKNEARTVTARYANLPNATSFPFPVEFAVKTDEVDDAYYTYAVGVAAVLRGARANATGKVSGGIQGFVSYKMIDGLENYSEEVISAGLRYEL